MVQDGVAMCGSSMPSLRRRWPPWQPIDELWIDTRLSAARAPAGLCGLSFSTIAGFNANGALPHYRATPEHFSKIEGNGLLLIDSGGQYLGGTTDITRVWPIGSVTPAQQRDYTLVLKGTIGPSRTVCPARHAQPHAGRNRPRPAVGGRPRLRPRHRPRRGLLPGRARGAAKHLKAVPEAHMAMELRHDPPSSPGSTGPANGACGSRTWCSAAGHA